MGEGKAEHEEAWTSPSEPSETSGVPSCDNSSLISALQLLRQENQRSFAFQINNPLTSNKYTNNRTLLKNRGVYAKWKILPELLKLPFGDKLLQELHVKGDMFLKFKGTTVKKECRGI